METYSDKINPILSTQFIAEIPLATNRIPKNLFNGTLVILNDGVSDILGFGEVVESTTTNLVKIKKTHTFATGMRLDSGESIIGIDYSNEDFDILELDGNVNLSAGDILRNNITRDGSVGFIADNYEDLNTGDTVKIALNCVIDLRKMVIDLSSICDELQVLAINSAFIN